MARFYGEIFNPTQKTVASKQGHKTSGLTSHIRGWNIGVHVACYVDSDGKDVIRVCTTGGTSNPGREKVIGEFHD